MQTCCFIIRFRLSFNMALRREGEWTLHKVRDGKYIGRESGTQRATVLTPAYKSEFGLLVGLDTYEVNDFSGVEAKFEELASGRGGVF